MRIYTAHDRPGSLAPDRDAVLLKEGFCWPAALFTVGWALWHRLWSVFAVLFVVMAGLEAALHYAAAGETVDAAFRLGASLIVGYCANDWRRRGLFQRGYRFHGIVAAANREAALRRYFDLHPAPPTGPGTAIGEIVA
ncbi:MAG: DUF2628 domain-containing protein [Alphaproteobacteria bacterium]